MSFRGRLLVFFTIIVVIPMIAVALVLFSLTEDSEHGKVDSRLAGGLRTTLSLLRGGRATRRARSLGRVAADDALVAGAASGRRRRDRSASARARCGRSPDRGDRLLHAERRAGRHGRRRADGVAAATVEPTTADGRAPRHARGLRHPGDGARAHERAASPASTCASCAATASLATTIPGAREPDAESGDVDIGGEEYRARVAGGPRRAGPADAAPRARRTRPRWRTRSTRAGC